MDPLMGFILNHFLVFRDVKLSWVVCCFIRLPPSVSSTGSFLLSRIRGGTPRASMSISLWTTSSRLWLCPHLSGNGQRCFLWQSDWSNPLLTVSTWSLITLHTQQDPNPCSRSFLSLPHSPVALSLPHSPVASEQRPRRQLWFLFLPHTSYTAQE